MKTGWGTCRRVRLLPRLAKALAFTAGVLVLDEIALRLGGLFVAGAPTAVEDGRSVVLCVGDSHTRGRDDPDNYPYQLQRILDERAAGRYRVINVGVPGMGTAQVRSRFERYLDYYHPAIVVHWAGINNGWRHPDAPRTFLARLSDYSRVVRMLEVALFYRKLGWQSADAAPKLLSFKGTRTHWQFNFGGEHEEVTIDYGDELSQEEVGRLTRTDLEAMTSSARERNVPMYLVAYPFWGGYYQPVNAAVRDVSAAHGVPFVNTMLAVKTAHEEDPKAKLFDPWVHPMPLLYRHIAEQVYTLLVDQGLVTPKSDGAAR